MGVVSQAESRLATAHVDDFAEFHSISKSCQGTFFFFLIYLSFYTFLNLISCIILKTLARNKNDIHLYYPDP